MKSRKVTIRFNPEKEDDRIAYAYLQTVGVSYSKAVIRAINGYLDVQGEELRKDAFLQQIRSIIQEELRAALMMGMMPYFQPPAEQKATHETEDTVLAFLDAFDGE